MIKEKLKIVFIVCNFCSISFQGMISPISAEPHSSVGSVQDLRTVGIGRKFDPLLGQYSFRGFMIVITTGFIPPSPLSIVSTMFIWESSQLLEENIVRGSG